MANEIGQILSPGQELVSSQNMPTETEKQSPNFQKTVEWLKRPENLMTAMVFLGSIVQPREGGRNGLQTLLQRGLGAVAFRDSYLNSQRDEADKKKKLDSELATAEEERRYKQEQVGIGKEQVAATRENTAADFEAARSHDNVWMRAQEQGNQTQMQVAQMQLQAAERDAQLQRDLAALRDKDAPFISAEDLIALQEASIMNGVPFTQMLNDFARARAMTDPRFAGMLNIGPAPTAVPGVAPAPQEKGKKKSDPKNYRSIPQPVPMSGLPDSRLGQSQGQGEHSAPPGISRPPLMYPGK